MTNLLDEPTHWRQRAEQMIAMAQGIADAAAKETMLNIAAGYEKLAQRPRASGGYAQAANRAIASGQLRRARQAACAAGPSRRNAVTSLPETVLRKVPSEHRVSILH